MKIDMERQLIAQAKAHRDMSSPLSIEELASIAADIQHKNVEDLEAQLARYLKPGPPFDPAPSKEYEGLLRQFNAAVSIIRSKQAQMNIYAEKNYQFDRDKHLAAWQLLNSEKAMNAQLTMEIDELGNKYEELKALYLYTKSNGKIELGLDDKQSVILVAS